jgi:hypothetical protein
VPRIELYRYLRDRTDLLRAVELIGPAGQLDERKAKKLGEIAGFCELILTYVDRFLARGPALRVVEFSCGKSYLGVVLVTLLRELAHKQAELVGVDWNCSLVEKCRHVADAAGVEGAQFVASRTRDFDGEGPFDLAVALHACDTATDEAIAKGIELGVPLILTVPCCQNQIRGQIKDGHPLMAMTEFGPIRYRLANMLTDVLRAQFLRSAGYVVEMQEIASPRLTPKNLCICARRLRHRAKGRRDAGYRMLREFFGVRPALERMCPGVVPDKEN